MFFEEGWIPVSEVTQEAFRKLQALKAANKIGKGHGNLRSILAVSMWDFLDGATKLGVTAPDGSAVEASRDLVAWADPTALQNEHVDLQAGSVGSSQLPDEHGAVPDEAARRALYGPFMNLPIAIPVNSFQSSIGYLEEEVKEDVTEDAALLEGARLILAMVEAKELVTREIARSRIGTKLTRRKFKLAWAIASAKAPELKRPNRWMGL